MTFPSNIGFAAMIAAWIADKAAGPDPLTIRDLTADECVVIDRVRAVQAALLALRGAPHVSDKTHNAGITRASLEEDGDYYCATLIAEIEAQPHDDAWRESLRVAVGR